MPSHVCQFLIYEKMRSKGGRNKHLAQVRMLEDCNVAHDLSSLICCTKVAMPQAELALSQLFGGAIAFLTDAFRHGEYGGLDARLHVEFFHDGSDV